MKYHCLQSLVHITLPKHAKALCHGGTSQTGRETEHCTNTFVQEGFLDLESGVPAYA